MNYLQKKKLAFMSIVNRIKGFVRSVSGVPPLTLPDCADKDSLINYTISGNGVGDYDETTGKYKIPVVCSGKNVLIPINMIAPVGGCTISIDNDVITLTQTLNNIYWRLPIDVKPNTDYTFSFRFNRDKKGTTANFGISTVSNPNGLIARTTWAQWDSELNTDHYWSYTFNSGEYTRLYFTGYISWSNVGTVLKMWDIQIEEGTTATDYEPYVEPVTTNIYLNEPLAEGETLKKPIKLPTFKGTTIYTVGTTVQPSQMSATYYATSKE